MKYGLHLSNGVYVTDPAVLKDVCQMVEELGYESILIGDHVLPPRKINSKFPLPVEDPQIHMYEDQTWPDCFAMMGFMASGEGLVCEFRGQGRVYIQSRNMGSLVGWLTPLLPS